MNRIVTIAFGLCFTISLGLIAHGQQIGPPSSSGGTPAGTTLQHQYNNAGAFGGANLWETNANTMERYNSTTAQVFNIYNTRTDASNYERLAISWGVSANAFEFQMQSAGTGATNRTMIFDSNNGPINFLANSNMFFDANGNIQIRFQSNNVMFFEGISSAQMNLKWNNDSTSDIGASGVNRPRDMYLGRNFSAAGLHADTGYSFQTPSTGFSITLGNTTWHTVLDPAGTLATGTIIMPAAPVDGQIINVRSSQIVSSLTVSGNSGQSIKGSPASFGVGGTFECMYHLANTTWYC